MFSRFWDLQRSFTCGLLQVPELPVYGVAIPTVSGMRLVLDELGAAQGDAVLHQSLPLALTSFRWVQLHSTA